jgi:diguanylate cyclase (GGDEF)-like protein/PAS domain S-box-containing protein
MAFAITIVSGALIWHQGESIKQRVLEERLVAVTRQARIYETTVAAAGIGQDRTAISAYLHPEMAELMVELGAFEALVTDETGRIIGANDPAALGEMEPAHEVALILGGASVVMRPERGDETMDFSFAVQIVFPAFRGALLVEEDIQALDASIAESTRESALPSVLILLVMGPLAAVIARRVLSRTQRSEQERAWQDRFQSLVQNASDVILVVDPNGAIQYATPAVERVLGRTAAGVHHAPLIDLIHPSNLEGARSALSNAGETPGHVTSSEYRLLHGDGRWVVAEVHSANLRDDPAVRGTVLTIRDITERKSLEAQLVHQALHDSLTGLANRALFNDRVANAVARARRGDTGLAVVVIDLDEFKLVNDTHGHPAGDAVLAQVGQRLLACIRDGDTVARLGGDEFAILLEGVTRPEVAPISARILAAFAEPVAVNCGPLAIQASVGVAHSDDGMLDTADLLGSADVAMYAAKEGGKGRLVFFEAGMRMAANERVEATAELRVAIDEGQLEVRYQPIVHLPSGVIRGMESLVRWRHPVRGEVMPSEFITLAETTGLIVPLGEFVLRQACRQARAWQLMSDDAEPLTISVNLSAAPLEDDGLMAAVRDALEESGLPPASLTLEITESIFVHDVETTTSRLHELKGLGVRLAIDDFGTGFSSLSYLRRFPVDIIKIDKSFVDGLVTPGPGLALATSIVRLARNLQLETVAEGVEQPEQLALLSAMGCDAAQGYLFARPLDVEAATDYVRDAGVARAALGTRESTLPGSTSAPSRTDRRGRDIPARTRTRAATHLRS